MIRLFLNPYTEPSTPFLTMYIVLFLHLGLSQDISALTPFSVYISSFTQFIWNVYCVLRRFQSSVTAITKIRKLFAMNYQTHKKKQDEPYMFEFQIKYIESTSIYFIFTLLVQRNIEIDRDPSKVLTFRIIVYYVGKYS